MVLLRNFWNMFRIPELTQKILFTLGVLIVFRLGTFIPAIGINFSILTEHLAEGSFLKGLVNYFNTFSAGALDKCSLFCLGISPYISASIMMQLLSLTIPYLEQLSKEGDYGRKQINQYTRYVAVGLSIIYAFSYGFTLQRLNIANPGMLTFSGWNFLLLFTLTVTVGSVFVMWLSEQISLFGLGNGSSMIIFAGIVSRFPSFIGQLVHLPGFKAILILLLFLVITGCIVYLEKGDRKIPVQYARRVVGQRVYGGQSTYIPFKINSVGVMPIIFASTLLGVPMFLFNFLAERVHVLKPLALALRNGGVAFSALEFGLIIFFTYFYAAIIYKPDELAENMKKSGGFIPGIRPGKQTASYFDYILTRINLVGAIYLGFLAIAPNIFSNILGVSALMISGTSLLIMVGVALETSAQIEAYLIEHRYEGFLTTGRVKNRVTQ